MRKYRLGDPDLDRRLEELIHDAVDAHGDHDHDEDIIAEMLVSGLKMLRDDTDRGDLKLVNAALKELRYAFVIFSRYRHVPKVTMYGSARTPPQDPNYQIAAEFASRMTDIHRWMVVTGAGPGIMEAGNRGAGTEYGFGVNIRLPFESEATLMGAGIGAELQLKSNFDVRIDWGIALRDVPSRGVRAGSSQVYFVLSLAF